MRYLCFYKPIKFHYLLFDGQNVQMCLARLANFNTSRTRSCAQPEETKRKELQSTDGKYLQKKKGKWSRSSNKTIHTFAMTSNAVKACHTLQKRVAYRYSDI